MDGVRAMIRGAEANERVLMTADQVKAALWHYVYKNHDFHPEFCSGCEMAQRAIDEYSGVSSDLHPWAKP